MIDLETFKKHIDDYRQDLREQRFRIESALEAKLNLPKDTPVLVRCDEVPRYGTVREYILWYKKLEIDYSGIVGLTFCLNKEPTFETGKCTGIKTILLKRIESIEVLDYIPEERDTGYRY